MPGGIGDQPARYDLLAARDSSDERCRQRTIQKGSEFCMSLHAQEYVIGIVHIAQEGAIPAGDASCESPLADEAARVD